jgi:ferredoxin, 2Fe-2S
VATLQRTVCVVPDGSTFEGRPGESVLRAAQRAGYRWPNVCSGEGSCTVCWMEVLEGPGHLSAVTEVEERWRRTRRWRPAGGGDLRLACQAVAEGPVVVRKRGVKWVGG